MRLSIHAAGVSLGNPGRAAAGAVLAYPDGYKDTRTRYLGSVSGNVATWYAVILAIQSVPAAATELDLYLDSELVVKQLRGEQATPHPGIQSYREQAMGLLAKFQTCSILSVDRDLNLEAVAAANQAIEERCRKKAKAAPAKSVAPPPKIQVQVEALFPELVDGPLFPPCSEAIRKFVQKAERKLSVKDYTALHSGRDAFSGMRLVDLAERLPSEAVQDLAKAFHRDDDRAKACRWVLRGLTIAQAVQKVKTDQDLGLSTAKNRERKEAAGV